MGLLSRRTLLLGVGASAVTAGSAFALPRLFRPRDPRPVTAVVPITATTDGAGVALRRAIGAQRLRMLDPFLLLDEFKSESADDYIKGFPNHPHRGFETVTVMLQGAMEHRDSVGNHGLLDPGSVQWMTAGRGLVHSEMPRQREGAMWGFQLWVNLPARLKMTAPRYQDVAPGSVPETDVADARVRVLAGHIARTEGPVRGVETAPTLLDVSIPAGGTFHADEIPADHTVFAYVAEGELAFADRKVTAGNLAVLGPGRTVHATGAGRMLLVAGAPIGEPVARRGPFVMNTDEEIRQAYADYKSGKLVEG
ncbi:MAG: pirin family protein [Pseudomonadota bacterium]|nr:pirin family protein [Pseudomonadota bacterium]